MAYRIDDSLRDAWFLHRAVTMTPKEPDMRELDELMECPACGTKCKRIATCTYGESGCDGSPKLVPLCEPMTVDELHSLILNYSSPSSPNPDCEPEIYGMKEMVDLAKAIHQAQMRRKTRYGCKKGTH